MGTSTKIRRKKLADIWKNERLDKKKIEMDVHYKESRGDQLHQKWVSRISPIIKLAR